MEKKLLTERDICTKHIRPAIKQAGWNIHTQVREEVALTASRVIVRGQMGARRKGMNKQHLIASKVDELMTLCDQLKAQLNKAQTTQLNLADALVDNALAV
jgi:type I site-specific restriction endonuclease